MVLQDPGIEASDTEVFHRFPDHLVIRGTGFWRGSSTLRARGKRGKRDEKVLETVPPRLDFDPPIDPEFIGDVSVDVSRCEQFPTRKRGMIDCTIVSPMTLSGCSVG